jgi:hypothetical protein
MANLSFRAAAESQALLDLFIQQLEDEINNNLQDFRVIHLLDLVKGNCAKVEPVLEALLHHGYDMNELLRRFSYLGITTSTADHP